MAAAYSMDLRTRVLKDSDAGLSSKELAERYHVSRAWVDALKQRRRETGAFAPLKPTKFRGRALAATDLDRLAAVVAANPDATLEEIREALWTSAGLNDDLARLQPARSHIQKQPYTPTNNAGPMSPLSGAAGATGRRWHDAGQYVFIDECGITTDLLRRYGRSVRGVRLRDHTPCGHWETHTIVAALRPDGITAPAVFDGSIDNASFRAQRGAGARPDTAPRRCRRARQSRRSQTTRAARGDRSRGRSDPISAALQP
jgi:transposase